MRFLKIVAVLILVATGAIARAADPSTLIRTTIDRGLAFVAKDALTWKTVRKCASCHHAPMAIWTLNAAKQQGFAIDEKALAELTAWVLAKDDPAKVFPKQAPRTETNVNQTPLMLALGFEAGNVKDESTRTGLAKMLATVAEQQRPDGSWGLLYIWEPHGSTPDVMTSLALLGLTSRNATELGPPEKKARDKGLAWLSATTAKQSLEGTAVKLLLWRRLGRPAADWQPLVQRIVDQQKADGGWSQTPDAASDAFATGQALYALAEAGLPATDPHVAKAQTFLVRSQDAHGSWAMASRPGGPGGKSAKNLAPIVHVGTAWAVMGLMRTTPKIEGVKVTGAK
jgi:hypothetical protein